jgi:hypothetical protein
MWTIRRHYLCNNGCLVGETIILHITTHCGQNTEIQKKLTATYKQNAS